MIFNFTKNYQFTTRLALSGENVEVVSETKLLGTIISDNLTWNSNTANIVKRTNARMLLLRKLSEFGTPVSDLKTIYISYIYKYKSLHSLLLYLHSHLPLTYDYTPANHSTNELQSSQRLDRGRRGSLPGVGAAIFEFLRRQ